MDNTNSLRADNDDNLDNATQFKNTGSGITGKLKIGQLKDNHIYLCNITKYN